jgi:ferredoxin
MEHHDPRTAMSNTATPPEGEPVDVAEPLPAHSLDAELDETLAGWIDSIRGGDGQVTRTDALPQLPESGAPADPADAQALLHAVRCFHRGEPSTTIDLATPSEDFIPALMHPFRDASGLRHDYPLLLYPPTAKDEERLVAPVADVLRETLARIAPDEDEARILKDNLPRLERHLREASHRVPRPYDAVEATRDAADAALSALKLRKEHAEQLRTEVDRLLEALPDDSRLLGLGPHTSLHLFIHTARRKALLRRAALRRKVLTLRTRLHDLLLINLGKQPEGRQAKALVEMVGDTGAEHVDPEALGRLMGPSRGARPMADERVERIERAIEALEEFLSREDRGLVRVVQHDQVPAAWRTDDAEWHTVATDTVCHEAAALFDRTARTWSKVFAAIRIAELDLADGYDPTRHDSLIQAFDWEVFSREELLALPPIIALETADRLAGEGMLCISRLQLSGRPVAVIVIVQPAMNPGIPEHRDQLMGWRFEMGYRGISHRESIVHQTAAVRPEHMLAGYERSLDSTRASLHIIASGETTEHESPPLGAWLHTSAAIEGRAHPLFHYDPGLGTSWARRFDFAGNPQPGSDWPVYELPCRASDGSEQTLELAFTFADYLLLESQFHAHFRVLPDAFDGGELIPVNDYFALSMNEALRHVPYIRAVDGSGQLHRLAITRHLAFACRDRLGFWRILQELAGVRNEHVELAVTEERARLERAFAEERAKLEEQHAAELDDVRRNAASEAMQRLAQKLMNTDVDALAAQTIAPARPAPPAKSAASPEAPTAEQEAPEEAAEAPPEPAAEEEDEGPQEPWIDSILCTSCNDCLNINNRLFVYNGNKQAVIGDPSAGTYKQLVEAAEKCPARCIHPGTPLNADEPDLEDLKQRAKKFS